MIDEVRLFKELNLTSQKWSEKPSNFYSFVALKLKDYFLKQLNKNKNSSMKQTISYRKLYELYIHQSLIEKAVMTIPYNASSLTILEYIKEFNNQKILITSIMKMKIITYTNWKLPCLLCLMN